MPRKPRIAIIGAGPIGLEAALYARLKGYEVAVYERGEVADHVRQWGHVRLFSPFGMNSSRWGRECLQQAGHRLPAMEAIQTGHEFCESYLEPLSQLSALSDVVHEGWHVFQIARRGLLKSELIGDRRRSEYPFLLRCLHTDHPWSREFDCVFDCTGTFGQSNRCGVGGARTSILGAEQRLPDFTDPAEWRYAGRHTMVIGSGYSAATNVIALAQLAEVEPGTRITWVTRHRRSVPIARLPHDRLPERDRLAQAANALATAESSPVDWRAGYSVRNRKLERETHRQIVELEETLTGKALPPLSCDALIANVGYRPDRRIYEELQVHECYATQGPMKLAAKLMGETSTDCLDQTSHGVDVLRNPEPNFYILGMKSYGRNSNFLIQVGLQQIVDVFTLIESDWGG